jgi:hypothetical protein
VDENIGEMLHDVILGSDFIGGGAWLQNHKQQK